MAGGAPVTGSEAGTGGLPGRRMAGVPMRKALRHPQAGLAVARHSGTGLPGPDDSRQDR